jgi:hypothetical protein
MDTAKPEYSGPERRRRRVYVTQNHEYHCNDGVCIAVRDTQASHFVPRHAAIGKKVTGALVLGGRGVVSMFLPEEVAPGRRIYFSVDVQDPNAVMTSALKSIERPSRALVAEYDRIAGGPRSGV